MTVAYNGIPAWLDGAWPAYSFNETDQREAARRLYLAVLRCKVHKIRATYNAMLKVHRHLHDPR